MSRWPVLALSLLAACEQAHWECVDPHDALLSAGDVTCKVFFETDDPTLVDAADACKADACTCRYVTNMCTTDKKNDK